MEEEHREERRLRWYRSIAPLVVACAVLALAAAAAGAAGTSAPAAAPSAAEAGFAPGQINPDAPPETAQFGRLAGIWDVDMAIRQDDGSWPKPGEGLKAEWRFRYILDGWAVQDDWIAPPSEVPVEKGPRQLGTNIRIYDPAAGKWRIAWISNTQKTLSTLEAVAEGEQAERMVLTGKHPSGHTQRVTFFDIGEDHFEWTLELQGLGDDADAWTEVARIHATRRGTGGIEPAAE